MSLSLSELKKKEENTMHSLRWMRGKMEARFKNISKRTAWRCIFKSLTENRVRDFGDVVDRGDGFRRDGV